PAVPIIFVAAGRELEKNIVLRHKFRIAAELPAHGIVGLSLTHYGLFHVRFHFAEALTEPALAVQETADL
ncbi:hypothetical protein B8W94_15010, partial [Lactococcus lactis]